MQNVRVMLVDDEAHIRLFIKTMLVGMGCQVVAEACNGKEALTLFAEHQPELVLLDINMPVMDGVEVLRELRGKSAGTVIIMLSSLVGQEVVETCLDADADYLLRKDLPLEEMRSEIARVWHEHLESHGGAA